MHPLLLDTVRARRVLCARERLLTATGPAVSRGRYDEKPLTITGPLHAKCTVSGVFSDLLAVTRHLGAQDKPGLSLKVRVDELESRLNAPSEELALAQMENRAFSKTLDALHTEVSRERAAGEKLRDQLKECDDELRKALIETNRLAAACR